MKNTTTKVLGIESRNYKLNKNGNSENLLSYVCNGQKIEGLFASTLNGIAASVKCMTSIIVVQNAKLSDRLRLTQTKKMMRNEKCQQK